MIGWGIIGVGDVTEVKANAAIFNTPDSRLVHVMRRTGHLAQDYAQRHGVPRWSDDAQAVIDDPEVDVVYIATPTASHLPYTLAALAAGKHVLVEKPIAMDSEQGQQMVAASAAADRRLWVAYYRRALPRYAKVRELVADGAIGAVRGVQVTWVKAEQTTDWRWDPKLNKGGEFGETVCHSLDLLDQFFGPAAGATGRQLDGARSIAACWQQGSVPASGSWVFGAGHEAEHCDLIGELGTLRFSFFTRDAPIVVTRSDGEEQLLILDPPHVHGPLVASIIAELRGEGTCPSTGESALRTARTVDTILG